MVMTDDDTTSDHCPTIEYRSFLDRTYSLLRVRSNVLDIDAKLLHRKAQIAGFVPAVESHWVISHHNTSSRPKVTCDSTCA
jgi:hypothetical protein